MQGLPVDTDSGPPLGLPLRFFLTGLVFLVAATTVGVLDAAGVMPGLASVAHAHLLLAGWACLTIMGAMAQFVPTWSGGTLCWKRLIEIAFPLVAVGIAGLAIGFTLDAMWLLPVAGYLAALGFWLFVAAMARTLIAVRPWDATEAHFALAIGFLAVVPAFGLLLAVDFTNGLLGQGAIGHADVLGAHATLAVFGVILTTILGALVQLGTMFTQAEPTGIDRPLLRLEQATYPSGVVLLAAGRLLATPAIARFGVVLVAIGLTAFGVVLARLLLRATVDYTPMHSRYGVVAAALVTWAILGAPTIFDTPLHRAALFGSPGARWLLLVGVVAFTVLGTLYHVIPFLVWLDRYADRVGLEPVPAIDDLYNDRVATVDLALTVGGLLLLVGGALTGRPMVELAGSTGFLVGVLLAVANLVGVVIRHVIRPDVAEQHGVSAGD